MNDSFRPVVTSLLRLTVLGWSRETELELPVDLVTPMPDSCSAIEVSPSPRPGLTP